MLPDAAQKSSGNLRLRHEVHNSIASWIRSSAVALSGARNKLWFELIPAAYNLTRLANIEAAPA